MTKTKLIFAAALAFFVSCASDDTANKQTEQEPGTEGLTSFIEEDQATRTTGEYDGSGLNFFWTAGDRLWVNTGTTTSPVLTQDSQNNIASKLENNPANASAVKRAAKAKFWFAGTFTASSYPVRYTGKNGAKDKVTIKAAQSQTVPNDASHIGEDGDFGVATATKPVGGGQYLFTLDHKAAYITFMPYTNQGVIAGAKIQKIRVFTGNTSDALAGTFDLADNGTLSNPTSTSNSVTLTVPNFSIPTTSTYATNGATMVVNPGTYNNMSIEYTLYDPVTYVTGTITKTYPSVTFAAGRNKKVSQDLQVTEYPGNKYYMWDAQQQYWEGYEWDNPVESQRKQPTVNTAGSSPYAPAMGPESASNPRGHRDDSSIPYPCTIPASRGAKDCPNVNECIWYAMEGKPHWDNATLWATMGHLYTGGMWFKKQSAIAAAQTPSKTIADLKAAAPDGTDYTNGADLNFSNTTIIQGKPTVSDLNDYFFLPAQGYYINSLSGAGTYGNYWSSTPYPRGPAYAYALYFYHNRVFIISAVRIYGSRVWTAQ